MLLFFSDPLDCSPPGSSVHGIIPTRTLERVAICFSRGSSPARDQTHISFIGRSGLPLSHLGRPSFKTSHLKHKWFAGRASGGSQHPARPARWRGEAGLPAGDRRSRPDGAPQGAQGCGTRRRQDPLSRGSEPRGVPRWKPVPTGHKGSPGAGMKHFQAAGPA